MPEFLSGLKDNNKVGADIRLDILSIGFKGLHGYNTIGINVRSSVGANVPGSLLRLAKEWPENKSYDISDLEVNAQAYAELALGHSHQINDSFCDYLGSDDFTPQLTTDIITHNYRYIYPEANR